MSETLNQVAVSISEATGQRFSLERTRGLHGGDINTAMLLEGHGRRYFAKFNSCSLADMFSAEADGLEELAAANAVRVPEVVCTGSNEDQAWLVLEYIEFGQGNSDEALGERLAMLHRHTAEAFGWHRDNTIGSTPQRNEQHTDWLKFWAKERLGFQLALAADNGAASRLVDAGERLIEVLPCFFSNYRALPSLLHGDLWSGNRATDSRGEPLIFDPAVYYGDRETDIAMTELFGGFGQSFNDAYNSNWPLDPGYSTRRKLYNLYHVLNHYNLFGGSYAQQAQRMIEQLLQETG